MNNTVTPEIPLKTQRFIRKFKEHRPKIFVDLWSDKTDAQRFIIEDIIVYALGILTTFGIDFLYNLLYKIGLSHAKHPYHLGIFQILLLLFLGIQFVRSLDRWRYYR